MCTASESGSGSSCGCSKDVPPCKIVTEGDGDTSDAARFAAWKTVEGFEIDQWGPWMDQKEEITTNGDGSIHYKDTATAKPGENPDCPEP